MVRSLEHLAQEAPALGASIAFLTPDAFRTVPMPTYREIRLAFAMPWAVRRVVDEVKPDFIHIATEGPIGLSMRYVCLSDGHTFTTSYHTRFPEYLSARMPVPERWCYAAVRRFHNAGAATMVSSPTLERDLAERGFRNLVRWSRGVNADLFCPREERPLSFPGPVFLYVGRVSVEKNVEAFLALDLPGTKVVVGDGPARAALEARYPEARFLGVKTGQELADVYASADVFVFPSVTDTFGIVLLEALASGLPIAAFPVMGPLDVVGDSGTGVLDNDLRAAALAALDIPSEICRAHALTFNWQASARQFLDNIRRVQTSPQTDLAA
ncbi:glycosyltransferase involved in cell wall biosynthesis [Pseudochelatococcus lubricantis]|uniref:Glycosyltransferase involved in cell wall biosynthesis n=1 Tax=Pseudochelatococcus lubricantis TaxID=1538102 RepID=A0ABX0UUL3_9HYPH|nr:glycosyltransferase involved in cell wall biosynthesis [Pseudochelatococcus lubricantis]